MKKEDILKGIYDDFFGIGKIEKENEKLRQDIKKLNGIDVNNIDIPSIEIPNEEKFQISKDEKDKFMQEAFKQIDSMYIEENSKEVLKKIVEYIRKYNEKIEKQFISFNMCMCTDNKETFENILQLLNATVSFFDYMPKGDIGIISVYDIQNVDDVFKIYNSDNNIIAFENIKAFEIKEMHDKEKILNKLNELIESNQAKYLTVLRAKNKNELENLFLDSEKLKNEFSTFKIIGKNPDIQEAYNEILEKIKSNQEISEEFQIKLLDYISSTYPKTENSYPEYRDNLIEQICFNKKVPEYENDKTIEEIFEELDSLVGLKKVKKMLRELVDLIDLKEKSKDLLNIKSINLHMVFLGNPGTGKTTVARIVSKILYHLKYIKQDKLLEVTSKDLVAEYVGQTAIKTMNVVQKALRRSFVYR